jgi:hypothetical protein
LGGAKNIFVDVVENARAEEKVKLFSYYEIT